MLQPLPALGGRESRFRRPCAERVEAGGTLGGRFGGAQMHRPPAALGGREPLFRRHGAKRVQACRPLGRHHRAPRGAPHRLDTRLRAGAALRFQPRRASDGTHVVGVVQRLMPPERVFVDVRPDLQQHPLDEAHLRGVASSADGVGLALRLCAEDAVLQRRVAVQHLDLQRDAVQRDQLGEPRPGPMERVQDAPREPQVGEVAPEDGLGGLGLWLLRQFVGDRVEPVLRRHPLQLAELEGPDPGRRRGGPGALRGGRGSWHRYLRGEVREKDRDFALLGSSLARARRRGAGSRKNTKRARGGCRGPSFSRSPFTSGAETLPQPPPYVSAARCYFSRP
ncbi:hypothetical protein [Longimicrobium sp.]|uniref:hypothetical protein n=1 Tax=Longimicrobium sp. TaxID=2029185 RepID=UPI002EDBA93D